jgi:hypothetical protein
LSWYTKNYRRRIQDQVKPRRPTNRSSGWPVVSLPLAPRWENKTPTSGQAEVDGRSSCPVAFNEGHLSLFLLTQGTRQIHVILYAKGDLRGATAPTDQLPIEEYTGRRARRYPAARIFLCQGGGPLELVAEKHYRCDTANAEVRKDGSLAYKIT